MSAPVGKGGPLMNKFEQVCSLGYQISLALGAAGQTEKGIFVVNSLEKRASQMC